jgi:hypothetical protein
MIQIILLIAFLIITDLNAYIDAKQILAGKAINHTLEYVIFLAACLSVTFGADFYLKTDLSIFLLSVIAVIGSTITRTAFFNFTLNLLRGLKLTYQSTTTTSEVDQIENKLGITDWIVSVIFLAIYITLFFIKII